MSFLWGKISTNRNRIVRLDSLTHATQTITTPHYEVHDGESFISDFVDRDMDNEATIILAFKTAAGIKRVHMWVEFTTLVGGGLEFWEGPVWTTNTGVVNSIVNRKRETTMKSSKILEDKTATPAFTATNNVLSNVTGLNTGSATSLHHFFAWGKKEQIQAGGARDSQEFILKPDTNYAAVFTAIGASNKAQVILNFYEHSDLDRA